MFKEKYSFMFGFSMKIFKENEIKLKLIRNLYILK